MGIRLLDVIACPPQVELREGADSSANEGGKSSALDKDYEKSVRAGV